MTERPISVTENTYTDAQVNGHTVRVTLYLNRNQTTALTLSLPEAINLRDQLAAYLNGPAS